MSSRSWGLVGWPNVGKYRKEIELSISVRIDYERRDCISSSPVSRFVVLVESQPASIVPTCISTHLAVSFGSTTRFE